MANGTAVAQRAPGLADLLNQALPKMMAVLPPSSAIAPEKIVRMALLDVSQSEYLRNCDHMSIVTSVMHAAALGLNIGPFLGEAYLVPFKGRCQLIPGYRGLAKLAMQGLALSSIEARHVYKGDYFRVYYGTDARIEHEPNLTAERPDEDIVAAYLVSKLRSGEKVFHVMTIEEILKRRDVSASKNSNSSPWKQWFPEMVLKTVVKSGLKLLPASADSEAFERVNAAVELDNRLEVGRIAAPNQILDNERSLAADLAERTADQAGDLRQRVAASRTTAKQLADPNAVDSEEDQQELDRRLAAEEASA